MRHYGQGERMDCRRYLSALMTATAIALLAGLSGCGDEPAAAYRPPACEPADELMVERALKEGFQHLHHGRKMEAMAAFAAALKLAPGHPEALAGQQEARKLAPLQPEKSRD